MKTDHIQLPAYATDSGYLAFRRRLMGSITGALTLTAPVPPPAPPPARPVFYGFFWSDCIHEAGLMLQSLHSTKEGAWRAMVAAQAGRWLACRTGDDSGIHTGLSQRQLDYRRERRHQAYAVRPVEVLL